MPPTSAGRGAVSAAFACRILIMAALPREVRPFLRRVRAKARRDLGLPAWEWEAGRRVVALSGMGEAAARRAGETLMGRMPPRAPGLPRVRGRPDPGVGCRGSGPGRDLLAL